MKQRAESVQPHPDRTLVLARSLVTLGEPGTIDDGAAVIENDSIVWVGRREEAGDISSFGRVVGSSDAVVIPGLVNAHYHSDFDLADRWLQFPIERGGPHAVAADPSPELARLIATARLAAAARAGTTTLLDFLYGHLGFELLGYAPILAAYDTLGLRASFALAFRDESVVAHGLNELPSGLPAMSGYGVPPAAQFEALDELARTVANDPLRRVMPAPDWTPTCSDALLAECVAKAERFGGSMSMHVLETRLELQYNAQRGRGPTMARLRNLGVLGPRTSLAHFVWATDEDIAILAETGGIAVLNPGSNLRLGSGIPRLRAVLDAGAGVAFGTDAISFSGRDDVLEELRLAEHLQRVTNDLEGGRLASAALLRGACESGAIAAGFQAVGTITEGASADLVVLDGSFASDSVRTGDGEVLDHIVDFARGSDVTQVMVGGRVIVDGGVVTGIDDQVLARELKLAEAHLRPRNRESELERHVDTFVLDYYRAWPPMAVVPGQIYNARAVESR